MANIEKTNSKNQVLGKMGKCGILSQYRRKHRLEKNSIFRFKTCTILTCMVSVFQLQNASEINF